MTSIQPYTGSVVHECDPEQFSFVNPPNQDLTQVLGRRAPSNAEIRTASAATTCSCSANPAQAHGTPFLDERPHERRRRLVLCQQVQERKPRVMQPGRHRMKLKNDMERLM
jgi:hypothetical protein